MNYIAEMTAFTDWLETNPLEPSAQTLWFHLLVIANKSGCPEWFTVANLTLMAKTGVSEKSLIKHRNALIQKGRLIYKNQGKQQAGKYQLVHLTVNNTVKGAVNDGVKSAVKDGVRGSGLFKDINSSATTSDTGEYESFYSAHLRVFGVECNPFQAQQLIDSIEMYGMSEEVVVRAVERAAISSKGYNFKLILKILDDYYKGGVRTLDQAIAIDREFDNRKSKTTNKPDTKVRSFAEMAEGMEDEDQ
ncbi:DnaD domain protein [Paenibacillus taichungensis]|uniref:DnaD domain protein n=1 Tax=Paenibacillus taichungensis TaxID=484184 RepID=UPI002DB89C80|nr:DnaD domain protein [Paenibacillus taichungensis]MEC0107250.1 DnaD domain protein [Paenibacillus taichungensis]MEC0194818.1 DnaD domain protein [Paenibacillus taichungensis]